jgi:hypothetical protein
MKNYHNTSQYTLIHFIIRLPKQGRKGVAKAVCYATNVGVRIEPLG